MIRAEDIARLDTEFMALGQTTDEWMEENEIDFDTLKYIAQGAIEAMTDKRERGVDMAQVLGETIANTFVLGWEAFRQYGPRSV